MTFEAVLVDLDDTLYPYDPCDEAGRRAAFDAYRERGGDCDRAAFERRRRAARRNVKRELPGLASGHDRHLYYRRLVADLPDDDGARDGPEDPAPGLALALGDAYWDAYLGELSAFPAVGETLATLREHGVAVAVVTNLTERIQLRKLTRLGVGYDALVTSEAVGREKPAAPVFTAALTEFGVAPAEALVVGNSPAHDIEGGNAVGATTALFNGPPEADRPADPHPLRVPDHELDSFGTLREVAI